MGGVNEADLVEMTDVDVLVKTPVPMEADVDEVMEEVIGEALGLLLDEVTVDVVEKIMGLLESMVVDVVLLSNSVTVPFE